MRATLRIAAMALVALVFTQSAFADEIMPATARDLEILRAAKRAQIVRKKQVQPGAYDSLDQGDRACTNDQALVELITGLCHNQTG